MVKRLLIIIPTLFLLSASPAFADGNIVAILVALRKQGVCVDSCSIYEYDETLSHAQKVKHYTITNNYITEYDETLSPAQKVKHYTITNNYITEYDDTLSPAQKIKHYTITNNYITEYDETLNPAQKVKHYTAL